MSISNFQRLNASCGDGTVPPSDLNLTPLTRHIIQQIEAAGGAISFDRWMAMALYDPQEGYYESREIFASSDSKGDFVTAANLGPWAALAFSDLIIWSWQQLGSPATWALVEQGGGSGHLLVDIAAILSDRHIPFPTLYAVEQSTSLRQQQQQYYREHAIAVAQHSTLEQLPPLNDAILINNELPDAFPVRRFIASHGQLFEQMVTWDGSRFSWKKQPQPLPDGPNIAPAISASWPHDDDYCSEWNPQLAPWLQQCADVARRSLLLCVDYGFTQKEYYSPQRRDGTLMGHQQHRIVEDVLAEPGQCDLTAHIDFTALLQAANKAGFIASAFMPQWAWLAQSPAVQQQMAIRAVNSDLASVQAIAQAKRLMLPQGMGETFKLFVASKGTAAASPDYLAPFNRLSSLQP